MASMAAELLTRAELDDMPDDGRRHELLDGAILVTPSPGLPHQDVAFGLALELDRASQGTGILVLMGPFDVRLSESTVLVPDIVVARAECFTDREFPGAPLLVVEVRSRSTARFDEGVKRDLYARAGVPSYWLVDPLEPSVTVLELVDGSYHERHRVIGDQAVEVSVPFPVTLRPGRLRRGAGSRAAGRSNE